MNLTYYVAKNTAAKRASRPIYFVRFTDRLLGELICNEEEAFTPEEMQETIRLWPRKQLAFLAPISVTQIPGPIRKKLDAVVNLSTRED